MDGSRSMAKAIALVLLPGCLLGQTVHGLVTDQASKLPVAGAIIQLVDTGGRAVSRALTNERGEFWVSALIAGTYRLRTLRIGFRPQTSEAVRLGVAEMIDLPLSIASLPVSLDTVKVASRNSCRVSGDTVVATYAIWEQVRGALTAAQLTAASTELTASTMSYERIMDPTFRGVRKQSTSFARSLTGRPWRSMSADSLRRFGYVIDDLSGGKVYLAPDLDVLLSPQFLEDHCMRLSPGSAALLIGIEFEPNKERDNVPEIRGTVWVDRASAEVRSMDFRYDNLSVAESDARPGGQMEFLRLRNGAWAIARWNIRMPVVSTVMEASGSRSMVRTAQQRVTEIRVAGGELISVLKGDDTTWARSPLSFSGTVVDSASRSEIQGARLTFRGTPLTATSDKDGRFTIMNALPGEYGLDIRTPSLDSVGGAYSVTVTVADGAARTRISVPSGDAFAAEYCPSAADSTKVSAFVLGSVTLEGDTSKPWNVSVTANWEDGKATKSVTSRTDATGRYRMCGLPVGRDLTVRTELDDTAAAPLRIRVAGRKRFALANITIPKPAVVAGLLFAGTVATEWSREPLPDAEIVIGTLGITARTNGLGRFRIAGVPPGTHRVSARKVGYAATEFDVLFSGTAPVVRQFYLGGVTALDPVLVRARPVLPDFEERRALGLGKFVTREQLAKQEGRKLSEVMRELGSVDLVQGRGDHAYPRNNREIRNTDPNLPVIGGNADNIYCPETRMEAMQGILCQCYAQVYLDKQLLNPGRPTPAFDVNSFHAYQVEAFEWFPGNASMPMEFARRGATCGVLVIHTRRSK